MRVRSRGKKEAWRVSCGYNSLKLFWFRIKYIAKSSPRKPMSFKSFMFPKTFEEKKKQEVANYLFLCFCMATTGLFVIWTLSIKFERIFQTMKYFSIGMGLTALGAMIIAALSVWAHKKSKLAKTVTDLIELKKRMYFSTLAFFIFPGTVATSFLDLKGMMQVHSVFLVTIILCYFFEWKPLKKLEKYLA